MTRYDWRVTLIRDGRSLVLDRSNCRAFRRFVIWWLTGLVVALFWFAPVVAQNGDNFQTAPVILDGRQLFEVSDSEQSPAGARAEWVSSQLTKAVSSPDSPQVEVRSRNDLPTIWLNDGYLLTVTEPDTQLNRSPERQARIWRNEIRQALQQARQERSRNFLRDRAIEAILAVLLTLAIQWGLRIFWRRYLREWLFRRIRTSDADDTEMQRTVDGILNLALAVVRLGLWIAVVFYIANLFPLTRQWSYYITDSLTSSLTEPMLPIGQKSYSTVELLILLLLLFGLVTLAGTATNLLRSRILHVTGIDRSAQEVITILLKYGLIAIGTLVLLQIWGLDLSSLTLLASALGVGIGFGFQDIAKNFGSGLVLLFERPIRVGDFIEVGDYVGTVERIGGRSTVIRTLDRVSIIVPNSRFLESEVINWSHDNPVSRLRIPVGVAYGSDIDAVEATLLEAARHHADVLALPPPKVLFIGFGNSSLDFELLVWCFDPSRQYFITSDLYFAIEDLLRQRDIEIPFPQRDLHVRSGTLPVELSPALERVVLQWLERSNGNYDPKDARGDCGGTSSNR